LVSHLQVQVVMLVLASFSLRNFKPLLPLYKDTFAAYYYTKKLEECQSKRIRKTRQFLNATTIVTLIDSGDNDVQDKIIVSMS